MSHYVPDLSRTCRSVFISGCQLAVYALQGLLGLWSGAGLEPVHKQALRPVRQLVLASPAYLAAHAPVRVPDDLMQHSCLAIGEQVRDSRWRFARGAETVDVAVRGRYTVNHSEMRLAAIEAGLGVGCVPDFVAKDALSQGRVVPVLPDWALDTNYQGMAYLLFPATRYRVPKVRVLIDHLVGAAALENRPDANQCGSQNGPQNP